MKTAADGVEGHAGVPGEEEKEKFMGAMGKKRRGLWDLRGGGLAARPMRTNEPSLGGDFSLHHWKSKALWEMLKPLPRQGRPAPAGWRHRSARKQRKGKAVLEIWQSGGRDPKRGMEKVEWLCGTHITSSKAGERTGMRIGSCHALHSS